MDYNFYNLMWDMVLSCGYAILLMSILYATFKILVYIITAIRDDVRDASNSRREVKSITLPFKGFLKASTDNIKTLTEQINLVKESNKISVKDILHITTVTTYDDKMECTIWYSKKKKREYKNGALYNLSKYDNLKILGD